MKVSFSKIKAILVFVYSLLIVSSLWSRGMEVLKTKYFDIIYSPESKASAALIYAHADEYAEEIASRLGKKLPHRYPIYISSNSELLNGYYTLVPYQRIVIYDATLQDGELGNSYDKILNVFYHELTHAISLWYWLPTLSLSFDEGVAVLFESRKDQGRLNDPLIAHHLMQTKIDGESPTWREAAGHRDVYPGSFWAYIYGASFLQYLEKIYGADKYIKYFHSNFFLFPKEKTKKIFGKTLEELWDDFIASINYPENVEDALPFSKEKMSNVVLSQSRDGFACYDSATRSVYFYDKNEKKAKLFSAPSGITDLNFSLNSSFLLTTDVKDVLGKTKQRLSIYDMRNKRFLPQRMSSVRYACFLQDDSICAVKVRGQYSDLVLLNSSLEEERKLLSFGPGLQYSHIYNVVYAGEDEVAFVAANGLYRDILILNVKDGNVKKLQLGEGIKAIRYLKSSIINDEVFLTFSWCAENMLYRMALYDVSSKRLKILDKDISGGVFEPIVFEKDDAVKMVYAGIHGKYTSLYRITDLSLRDESCEMVAFDFNESAPISEAPVFEGLSPKKYNPFSWLWRVLPLPYIKSDIKFPTISNLGFGAHLYGKDPTEFIEFYLQPVFYIKPFFMDIESNLKLDFTSFNLNFSVNDRNVGFAGRSTSFSLNGNTDFSLDQQNKRIFMGAGAAVMASLRFPRDIFSSTSLYPYRYTSTFLSASLVGGYSQVEKHYRLATKYFAIDKRGFRTSVKTDYVSNISSKKNMFVLQTTGSFYVPVVPLKMNIASYYGYNAYYQPSYGSFIFVTNKSFVGTTSYLPDMSEYKEVKKKEVATNNNLGFSFDFSLRVFSYEIQKGSNLFLIYFNRINFELGYRSILNIAISETMKTYPVYFQSFYGDLYLDISSMIKFGARYSHPIEAGVKLGKFSAIFKADIFF